jgi:small subunit ribosomal protein S18
MRDNKRGKPRRGNRNRREFRPRICRFCENKINYVDFLDGELLSKFQTENGRILPRRVTGTCLDHQKMLSRSVKRARILSLVF